MTDKPKRTPPDFIKALIAAFRAKGSTVEEYTVGDDGSLIPLNNENALKLIHREVDIDLVNAMQQWFNSQQVKQLTVMSSLAFMMANEIYNETRSDEEACAISSDYEKYIHQTVHALRAEFGPPKKSK